MISELGTVYWEWAPFSFNNLKLSNSLLSSVIDFKVEKK